MKVGKWTIIKGEVEGFELLAPISYFEADRETIEEKTGGCGPGEIGDWFVPDTIYGESIFLACQIHDWMYGEGENKEDKKWADIIFLVNMTLLITQDEEITDHLALVRVMTYFQAVFYGGADSFDKGVSPKGNDVKKIIDGILNLIT